MCVTDCFSLVSVHISLAWFFCNWLTVEGVRVVWQLGLILYPMGSFLPLRVDLLSDAVTSGLFRYAPWYHPPLFLVFRAYGEERIFRCLEFCCHCRGGPFSEFFFSLPLFSFFVGFFSDLWILIMLATDPIPRPCAFFTLVLPVLLSFLAL